MKFSFLVKILAATGTLFLLIGFPLLVYEIISEEFNAVSSMGLFYTIFGFGFLVILYIFDPDVRRKVHVSKDEDGQK